MSIFRDWKQTNYKLHPVLSAKYILVLATIFLEVTDNISYLILLTSLHNKVLSEVTHIEIILSQCWVLSFDLYCTCFICIKKGTNSIPARYCKSDTTDSSKRPQWQHALILSTVIWRLVFQL